MMKKARLFLLFLCMPMFLYAQLETDASRAIQYKSNPKYRAALFSIGSVYLKNSYLSPLSYSGISVGLSTNTTSYHKWGAYDWAFYGQFDLAGDSDEMMGGQLKYESYWHWILYSSKKLFLYAGIGAQVDGVAMLNNNSVGYNQFSANMDINALPSLMLKYRFQIFNQSFDFSQQISTPVLGFGIYPRYGHAVYGSLSDSDDLELGTAFSSLNNCWGLSGRTYVDWRIKNKTGAENNTFVRIGYQYDGFHLNYDENTFQYSRGLFIIGLVHKF